MLPLPLKRLLFILHHHLSHLTHLAYFTLIHHMNSLFFPVFKRGAHVSAAGGGPAVRPADNGGQAPRPHAGQIADQQDHKHPH